MIIASYLVLLYAVRQQAPDAQTIDLTGQYTYRVYTGVPVHLFMRERRHCMKKTNAETWSESMAESSLENLNLLDDYMFMLMAAHPEYGESFCRELLETLLLSYDPFGEDRICYTIRNTCVENPRMPYDDGAVTLYFNAKGKTGSEPQTVKDLLKYLSDTRRENAVNDSLKRIQYMVDDVRKDPWEKREYMDINERMWMFIDEQAEKLAKERAEKLVEERAERLAEERAEKLAEERAEKLVEDALLRAEAAEKKLHMMEMKYGKLEDTAAQS